MLNSLFIGNQDGGIISTITQAPQSDEPVVIIGLGGTGVDAITRLKIKLKKQIVPNNKDDVEKKGEEPQYAHIKFLGIDADAGWLESSGLTQAERLNIQNTNYPAIFAGPKLPALKNQKELQWMSIDYMARHLPPTSDGAGTYRQFGRWLTISKAGDIKTKLNQVITQACTGRNGGKLNVHIVSSISGGMGAGSFVDVCYIAREVIDGLGFQAAKVFGYFVLPDAIISKDGILGNDAKIKNNQKNGMASLLEIEHLMNLEDSHEWFEQDYGSFQIRTQHKLVDMCHFVSATNMENVPIPKGYEYALNVIGDYILAFVSKEMVAGNARLITMEGNLANIDGDLTSINPEFGYSLNYHIIGSANAEIPTTQMATYLATELFKKLTIRETMPDNIQIEQEFASELKLTEEKIKQLENKMVDKAGGVNITGQEVKQHFSFIKQHMKDPEVPLAFSGPAESSLKKRKGIVLKHREDMEKDVERYIYEAGASSIPGKALNKLIEFAEDPLKGPIYAYGMMNRTGEDIRHYLDGWKKYYAEKRLKAEENQEYFLQKQPVAKCNLGNATVFNKSRLSEEYANTLNNLYFWEGQVDLYSQMEILMSNLRKSFDKMNKEYLQPLYDITQELIETFEANSTYFDMGKGDQSQDGFTKQLVKFSGIQEELDTEIDKLDPKAETTGLLKILTENPGTWMERKETKLKAIISEYILGKFNPILSGSLESFLRKDLNMEAATNSAFADEIQKQVIDSFVSTAAPVFWTSEAIVSDSNKTVHRSVLTVPSAANCVCLAAEQHKDGNSKIEVRKSLINDRIYVLRTISGVPMHAYQGITQYLNAYKEHSGLGLHMYERNINWREILTFPYPYSYNPQYTENAEELLELYEEAKRKGIIYYVRNTAYVKQFGRIEPDKLSMETILVNGKIDQNVANKRIAELEEMLQSTQDPIEILSKGNNKDNKIVKDNYLRFYGIQQAVREEIKKYNDIDNAISGIHAAIEESNMQADNRKKFFDALLVGAFADDGFNVTYDYVQHGMQKTAVLCNNSMSITGLARYYQAFCTMCKLEKLIQSELFENVNVKFDQMSPKEKKVMLDKLLAMYNPQVLSMISNNFAGKLEQKEIDDFYAELIQYLHNLNVLIMTSGALE